MNSLGSLINCIALSKSVKLTLQVNLRDEAGEMRFKIKVKSLGFNENESC